MDRPSPAVQDYLKAIYQLDEQSEAVGPVTTSQVAEALAVTAASASNMLTKLDTLDLPPFVCQYDLFGQTGRRYRADFFWREQGVLLETDGRSAHQRREDFDKDRARDNDLLAVGLRTMRVTRRQLRARTFAPQLLATLGV